MQRLEVSGAVRHIYIYIYIYMSLGVKGLIKLLRLTFGRLSIKIKEIPELKLINQTRTKEGTVFNFHRRQRLTCCISCRCVGISKYRTKWRKRDERCQKYAYRRILHYGPRAKSNAGRTKKGVELRTNSVRTRP
jgi:hypothetical protein